MPPTNTDPSKQFDGTTAAQEAAITEKMVAGLSRTQAIEVLTTQAEHDAAQKKSAKSAKSAD